MNDPMWLRLLTFITIFILCALWEWRLPRRTLLLKKRTRWYHNLSLVALNSAVVTLLIPIAAVQAGQIADAYQWGLFNQFDWPVWTVTLLSIVALDFVIYWQHRLFHHQPLLWRLHRVHHADQDIDVTTGLRFHPLEIILSMLVKIAAIWLLGANALAVLLFEIILNGSAMFNHSNGRLHLSVDRVLRCFLVTPDMHRIHHSVYREETQKNFGFCLSLWDRCFNSYCSQPKDGHEHMSIGIKHLCISAEQRLIKMLTQPFRQ